MSFHLPDHVVDVLLDKLGSDDAFRAAFATDARGALASLGFEPAADGSVSRGIWMCLTVKELASKEAIRASAGDIRAMLRIKAGVFYAFALDAQGVAKVA
jgi:putative modified peptide